MRNIVTKIGSFFCLIALIYWSFSSLMPTAKFEPSAENDNFSLQKSYQHVKKIGKKPHSIGTSQHSLVRNYIVGELQKMGLNVQTQKDNVLTNEGIFTTPENIIVKIQGKNPTPKSDLLVLSHYDSAVHSAPGASDAASGVATILESLRVFLEENPSHKNNIIVCFTDAEEIGLVGAALFAKKHPWAQNLGLLLNFEARGSGGPSNMILETNHGNAKLIDAFAAANPKYPVASSLMYSVYKKLPNDTDATVFREQKDVPGFFFAFIDDHFDYHTATDLPKHLDKTSLAHQASYLTAVLPYFANIDLAELSSEKDHVYFNFPRVNLVHYPFSWIFPMLILAWVLFLVLIVYGFRKKRLVVKPVLKGIGIFLGTLILLGLIGVFGWKLIYQVYPEYHENLHGFVRNGHQYIAAFVLLSLAILCIVYHKAYSKENNPSLMVAPLLVWLLVNTLLALYLKGAAYFCIPVYFALLSFWVMIRQREPNNLAMVLLAIPAIILFAPLIQFFPVGLGLKMMVISLALTVLLFGLLLPILGYYRKKNWLSILFAIGSIGFFIAAHGQSSFSEKNKKPNSLVYLLDVNQQTATWNTYDTMLDDWVKSYISGKHSSTKQQQIFDSKYHSPFTFSDSALVHAIPSADYSVAVDSSTANKNRFTVKIAPHRDVNRMEFFVDKSHDFLDFSVNGQKADSAIFKKRYSDRLLTYYVINRDTLQFNFSLKKNEFPAIEFYEASHDLLDNPWINVPPRTKAMMPKPFVLNDAIITRQSISLDQEEPNY